jgi:SAM-dependent methyltransferase|tara:strand:+ start:296 stop:958 length:663 start_codon:yes stop_codon:yes gene_type:complete
MKREVNLLEFYPQSKRPIDDRGNLITEQDRAIARKFDVEYFDGDRLTGYGGYNYSPRFWTDTVAHIKDFYHLDDNSKILDIGCAKGYMMHDLSLLIPGAEIKGVDVSNYAKENAIESMQDNIVVANANNLPFTDDYFDLVIAINTLHNLPLIDCKQAFREINRVTKNNSFVMNDAWRDAKGKQSMLKWNLTALTYMSCDDWEELFKEVDYKGDYYWFFAE